MFLSRVDFAATDAINSHEQILKMNNEYFNTVYGSYQLRYNVN